MKQYWIFTFGCGQENAGHYVKVAGNCQEAREKMIAKYGTKWCFQYSEGEWESFKNNPDRYWKLETELEVIE